MIIRLAAQYEASSVVALYECVVNAMRDTPFDARWDMAFHPTADGLRAAIAAGNLFVATDGEPYTSPRIYGAFVLDDEQDAGYTQASWPVAASDDEVAVIHLLAVSPTVRGLHIGAALVNAAARIARERGKRAIRLDVVANNDPAVNLYRSCGLVDLGIFTLDYGGGLVMPAHLMELDLVSTETACGARTLLAPSSLASCELCPRRCHARRASGEPGICGAAASLKLARAALHLWEEPPISGDTGSGTIFFSGCPLKCVYCQNHEISTGNFGIEVDADRLSEIMLELQYQGALNINLVTATHYAHLLPAAVEAARARGLFIPIVYNTGGYERERAVRELEGIVDVWLTDFKYADAALARDLSHVADYPDRAARALARMVAQVDRRGGIMYDGDGTMQQGIIVRHLVLPGHADDSCRVLDLIWDIAGDIPISVMNQYTPNNAMRAAGGELARAVTDEEYEQVLDHADELGFTTMFWQEGGAVSESFTPAFDTTGVLAAADGPILPRQ